MTKYFKILLMIFVLFSGCKSNQDAYNTTYRRLKEKEAEIVKAKAKTAMSVPKEILSGDSSATHISETINLIAGEGNNLSDYSIVVKSFINKTNARGYQARMIDDGYPAVLVQNEELMYRIIVASFESKDNAANKLNVLKNTFPEAWILVRLKN